VIVAILEPESSLALKGSLDRMSGYRDTAGMIAPFCGGRHGHGPRSADLAAPIAKEPFLSHSLDSNVLPQALTCSD